MAVQQLNLSATLENHESSKSKGAATSGGATYGSQRLHNCARGEACQVSEGDMVMLQEAEPKGHTGC